MATTKFDPESRAMSFTNSFSTIKGYVNHKLVEFDVQTNIEDKTFQNSDKVEFVGTGNMIIGERIFNREYNFWRIK